MLITKLSSRLLSNRTVSLRILLTLVFTVLNATTVSLAVDPGTRFDFDGDRKADLAIFRPSNGTWYIQQLSGYAIHQFGQNGDVPVAADYDGDLKSDIGVYRAGAWYVLKSATFTWYSGSFGLVSDIPAPEDFDGDLKADVTVFRPATGQWYQLLSNGGLAVKSFGLDGDIPVAADYDGDLRTDIAVFRPSTGVWYRMTSGGSFLATPFGLSTDIPVTGDYDGDRSSDLAVWRPSTGVWYTLGGSGYAARAFGTVDDIPTPADYDGDGKTDLAVWRPASGDWYQLATTAGFSVMRFGISGDIPASGRRRPGTPPWPTPTPTPPPATFTCDYYASPNGTAAGTGTGASPWDLQTGLNKTTLVRDGKTLCLTGGTYYGKFQSTLNGGGVVRSAPGEWAIVDGNVSTTLTSSMNSSQTTFTVADARAIYSGSNIEVWIDNEVITVYGKNGNTISNSLRNADGSSGGTAPHAAGSVVRLIGQKQVEVTGSNTTYRDFEIKHSYPFRGEPGNYYRDKFRGIGINNLGSGNSFINLLIHDNLAGIFTGSSSSNTLIYGCLIYNNGLYWDAYYNFQSGPNLYLENASGYSRVYESMMLNSFRNNAQYYGVSGAYAGGDTQGSVFVGGGLAHGTPMPNLIFGTGSVPSATGVVSSSHFVHGQSVNTGNLTMGYSAGVSNATITNNYFIGAEKGLEVQRVDTALVTGNKFYTTGGNRNVLSNAQGYTWNNNTYYATGSSNTKFGNNTLVASQTFAAWKTSTGFDGASSMSTSALPDEVIIRPNSYERGRANIVIHANSGATSTNINLSTSGLSNGQAYVIRNAFNWYGPLVASGTYNSWSPTITVALNGAAATVAIPTGRSSAPATTAPKFVLLVVVPS